MTLLSHPTGNANVRQAALALLEAGLLGEFWTCLSCSEQAAFLRFLPGPVRRQLVRRATPEALFSHVKLHPWREVGRLLCAQIGWTTPTRHERGVFSVDAVYRSLDRTVARRVERTPSVQAVYAYEDGAADTFAAARARGIPRLYDLPIGYWRSAQTIYAAEVERTPAWAATLTGVLDSEKKRARKEAELRDATHVVVASAFTKSTLADAPFAVAPVTVIPYGAPPPSSEAPERRGPGPLKVLFVGSLGQRKGLSYLLEAMQSLGQHAALNLLGRKAAENCAALNQAVRAHRWVPTLPHAEVLSEMKRHDVLVFPSLFEGFGLVLLEALSQGIPVITTAHTAGPDLLAEGENGYVVSVGSSLAIAEKLQFLVDQPDHLHEMKIAAWRSAATFRWKSYRERLAAVLRHMITP